MAARAQEALQLMLRFAERTGVDSQRPPQRYLWTDAFAVCNLLGLGQWTATSHPVELVLQLVDQVHQVLGRHRADDVRSGWISGLAPEHAAAHPTCGGLRIGKPLPERRPEQPFDERVEWERDGQYFHYLTKWMHALDQVSRATGQPLFNAWARELAQAAHRAFTYAAPGGKRRMYWKVSIDLSRPLVASMGQHDPLDGLITCVQLQTGRAREPRLDDAAADFAAMVEPRALATGDPLGIGGLLMDAYRLDQLARENASDRAELCQALLEAALAGLSHYAAQSDRRAPASHRLAFRELGLAIGLAAVQRADWTPDSPATRAARDQLLRYVPLRSEIENFWLQPENRRVDSWVEHENINDVMLATCLHPDGFLVLQPQPSA